MRNYRFHNVSRLLLFALVLHTFTACCKRTAEPAPRAYRPDRDEYAVMTYNLYRYGKHDRDNDGVEDDPKPSEEREAVLQLITAADPDILAVQEIGPMEDFEAFRTDLRMAGLTYEHVEFLARSGSRYNMAVLSRLPILSRQSHTNDVYTIGAKELSVGRGFIDITLGVSDTYQLRLFVAHLKSKRFSEWGQTEMRRNEARLLSKHVRRALKEDPSANLLVVGDLNDSYNSAAVRSVTGNQGEQLIDLRLRDYVGDTWTYFGTWNDQYDRIDYVLVSHGLHRELTPAKSRVVRHASMMRGSDHRPLVAVFKNHER